MSDEAMIVDLIPPGGIGTGKPVRFTASQVVLRMPDGTIFGIAHVHGPDGSFRLVKAGDSQFQAVARGLGLGDTACEFFSPGKRPDGRRVAGPR